jgi:hypothetical protein
MTPTTGVYRPVTPTSDGNRPTVINHPDGSKSVTTTTGSRLEYNGRGKITSVTTQSGAVAKVGRSGRITSIRANNMTINRGPRGEHTVITERADHSRVVTMGPHRGFEEHPFMRNGRPYLRRTYSVNGHTYARVYRGYPYRGGYYYHYVPAYYYAPGFYGWVGRPWGVSVAFAWGWGPWYGPDAYYFAPYPVYTDPGMWLTDYVISQNLQAAYDAQQETQTQSTDQGSQDQGDSSAPQQDARSTAPALTPEVKEAIAEEVKAQLDAEKDAAAAPQATPPAAAPDASFTPDALNPTERAFVVSTTISEPVADGTQCSLNPGDILMRVDDTPDSNNNVKVAVASSQHGDCSGQVSVSLQDLQDMYNNFREKMDDGLQVLAQNQGKNGMPAAPTTSTVANAEGAAQPDLTTQADFQQQQQTAAGAENDANVAAGGGQ